MSLKNLNVVLLQETHTELQKNAVEEPVGRESAMVRAGLHSSTTWIYVFLLRLGEEEG